uniref:Heat shock protein binding protein n=1 Tax=Arundo donax TaxID=35708 RepID=A0A0A9DM97_ARUDO
MRRQETTGPGPDPGRAHPDDATTVRRWREVLCLMFGKEGVSLTWSRWPTRRSGGCATPASAPMTPTPPLTSSASRAPPP